LEMLQLFDGDCVQFFDMRMKVAEFFEVDRGGDGTRLSGELL
jgi:hypothetical protein